MSSQPLPKKWETKNWGIPEGRKKLVETVTGHWSTKGTNGEMKRRVWKLGPLQVAFPFMGEGKPRRMITQEHRGGWDVVLCYATLYEGEKGEKAAEKKG